MERKTVIRLVVLVLVLVAAAAGVLLSGDDPAPAVALAVADELREPLPAALPAGEAARPDAPVAPALEPASGWPFADLPAVVKGDVAPPVVGIPFATRSLLEPYDLQPLFVPRYPAIEEAGGLPLWLLLPAAGGVALVGNDTKVTQEPDDDDDDDDDDPPPEVVPEPATAILLGSGLLLLAAVSMGRRRLA